MTINIAQACVYLCQNVLIITTINETSIIIVCNSKNLIGSTDKSGTIK